MVEEAVNQAKERKTFLEHITLECVKETNLDLGIAKKLLLGDLEHRSDEAKVRSLAGVDLSLFIQFFLVLREMSF